VLAPLGPQDDDAADHERGRHRHRIEQHRFDLVFEQQAENAQRHRHDDEVEQETAGDRTAVQREGRRKDLLPEFPDDREDRGALDDDELPVHGIALQAEHVAREDQVSGARDRQEFGDALDEPQDDRFEN
jgi:hypothetical protein